MGYITYCTLCLVTNVKIYKMSSAMYSMYNELIETQNMMNINQMHACYECAHLLQKYKEFKTKCCNAFNLLQQYADGNEITEKNLKSINRKQNNLESKLTTNYKYFYDLHVCEEDIYENVEVNGLKTEPFAIEDQNYQVTEYNLISNTTPSHLDYSMMGALENPLQIKEEVGSNEKATITANDMEMVKFDLHNEKLNKHTEYNDKALKTEMENNYPFHIEIDYKSTRNPSDDDMSDSDSNDNRYNINFKQIDALIDKGIDIGSDDEFDKDNDDKDSNERGNIAFKQIDAMIDLDSDDDSDKDNDDIDSDDEGEKDNDLDSDDEGEKDNDIDSDDCYDDDDNDNDEDDLNKLIEKYSPIDTITVKIQDKLLTSFLRKRKLKMQSDMNKGLVKKRKKIKVSPRLNKCMDDIMKIKYLNDNNMKKSRIKNKKLNLSLYENYVTIIELTTEDALREVLLRKETSNYKVSKYKCDLCFRGYNYEATYQTHMKRHSLEEGPIKCDICQLRVATKRAISRHMSNCHTYKFTCKLCPYVCSSMSQCKAHILLHKGKQYSCPECNEKFKFPHSVSSHYRLKHKLEHVCEFCGNAYGLERGLLAHKIRNHKNEKNELQAPKCDECKVHFSNERAWKRHFVLCTRHTVRHGCMICGEVFDDASGMRKHSKQHERYTYKNKSEELDNMNIKKAERKKTGEKKSGEKKVGEKKVGEKKAGEKKTSGPCQYCNAPFNKHYESHILQCHPDSEMAEEIRAENRWVCEICGAMFKQKLNLKMHQQRTHVSNKPYSCDKCGKRFTSGSWLKAHETTHTKVFPYKCHLCTKAFGTELCLKRHVKYHTDRPFSCTNCERTFTYLSDMRCHVKYVHDKMPWPKRDRNKSNLMNKEKQENV